MTVVFIKRGFKVKRFQNKQVTLNKIQILEVINEPHEWSVLPYLTNEKQNVEVIANVFYSTKHRGSEE